jgi:hypothetical protein
MELSRRQTRWFALGALPLVLGCAGAAGAPPAGGTGGARPISSGSDSSSGGAPGTSTLPKTTAPCVPDETAPAPDRGLLAGFWQKIELPGTVCSNGSPYKFFVNYASSSNNLVVTFEGGGACWDYGSCAGNGGLRGAANTNGIADDHMVKLEFLPLNRRDASNPVGDWNMVFLPYCTGDLHTGNLDATYANPDPTAAPLVYRHRGHDNMVRVIQWLAGTFPTVPRLLVTGYSAGGSGSLINYHFIRKGMAGVQCGYLLDDSGPIFPSAGYSGPLHRKVREAWNLDPLIDEVAADFAGLDPAAVRADLGLITTALADKYPRDRLSTVLFRLDFNYSLYSYERFYNNPPQAEIHRMWWEDIQRLLGQYASRPNLATFIPYYRGDNCSHCLTIPPLDSGAIAILAQPYAGTEIQERGVDVRDFVQLLIDDSRKLESFLESEQPGEGLSPEHAAQCQAL